MIKLLGLLVPVVVGIIGILFGSSQRKKLKAAKEEVENLSAELEQKRLQAKTAEHQAASHVAALGEIVEASDSGLADRADDLFTGSRSLGDELKELRYSRHWSLAKLSKASGYPVAVLADFERDKGIDKKAVKKLADIYEVPKEEKDRLLSLLEGGAE